MMTANFNALLLSLSSSHFVLNYNKKKMMTHEHSCIVVFYVVAKKKNPMTTWAHSHVIVFYVVAKKNNDDEITLPHLHPFHIIAL